MCFLTATFVLVGQFIFHKSQELLGSSKIWKKTMLKQDVLLNKICIKSSNLEENQQPLVVLKQKILKGFLVLSAGGSPVHSAFLAALPHPIPNAGLRLHFPGRRPRAGGTHRLVGSLLLPASLPHSQIEGIFHASLQPLPRDGDYAVSTGPKVQHTPTTLALWPRTGAMRSWPPLKAEPDPEDSRGPPSPCWDQAHQDSASK